MMVEKGKDFPILSYPSLPLHVNKGNKSSRMRTIKTEGERWNAKEGNQKSERMNKRVTTLKAEFGAKNSSLIHLLHFNFILFFFFLSITYQMMSKH